MSTPPSFPAIPSGQLERICRILGDCTTGTGIDRHFRDCGIEDTSNESTKWKRLYFTFHDLERIHGCSNHLCRLIKSLLAPSDFIGQRERFEEIRRALNQNFLFSGIEYREDGEFHLVSPARTLSEAERRCETLSRRLNGRAMHPESLKYCRSELLQDNFFHAVFEASKGLAQRIRDLSGVDGDGAALVDRAFLGSSPLLAFNFLATESDWSEHRGFAALLKGCFSAVRNPLAHEPKILWQGEEDAADYFTLISMLHRKLDRCVRTNLKSQ
jgi:uncharacterized protein (TIGR02391 family)